MQKKNDERKLEVYNFINDFIVTIRFKVAYDNKPVHQYKLQLRGEYNLSKNLTISNKQPLFSLLEVKKKNKENIEWKWK